MIDKKKESIFKKPFWYCVSEWLFLVYFNVFFLPLPIYRIQTVNIKPIVRHMKQLSLCFLIIPLFQLRYSYSQTWEPLDHRLEATVYSATSLHGEIYAATSNAVMRYNGSQFDTIGLFNSQVSHLGAFNSELYAAGSFTQVDGNTINGIARWDGASWHPLGTGVSPHANFFIEYNNELYVTGSITTAGGISVSNIARWSGTEWNDVGSGFNGVGNKMEVHNSELFVLGYFTQAGGTDANNIARWNGAAWEAVSTGLTFYYGSYYGSAFQNLKHFNNRLFVSEYFLSQEGRLNLAIWDNNNWTFKGFNNYHYVTPIFMATSDDAIYAMSAYNGGQVYKSSDGSNWKIVNNTIQSDTLFLDGIFIEGNKLYAYGEVYADFHNLRQNHGILLYDLAPITSTINHKNSANLNILTYPNPVSDILYFESRMDQIEVFNAQGMSVARHQQVSEISMAELPAGVYLIRSGEKQARVVKR